MLEMPLINYPNIRPLNKAGQERGVYSSMAVIRNKYRLVAIAATLAAVLIIIQEQINNINDKSCNIDSVSQQQTLDRRPTLGVRQKRCQRTRWRQMTQRLCGM